MMKINLKRLKLHPRESESFTLSSNGDDRYLAEIGGKFLAPIHMQMEVENTGSMFVAKGQLSTLIKLPCSRCLKEYTYPVDTPFDIVMAEDMLDPRLGPDEGVVLFHGDEVDIKAEINQAVYMALPIGPVCEPNCQGLCPYCGIDKNSQTCNCEESNIDPRWEQLKNLK